MFSLVLDTVVDIVVRAVRAIFLLLSEWLLKLAVLLFDAFERLGTAEILNNEIIRKVYSRIGLLIGIFMLFRVSFAFIQYLINPDLISDSNKGAANIVKRILIVVVLLGTTPYLFREAFSLQNFLIRQNVVGRIIAPETVSVKSENVGKDLTWYIFSSFFDYNVDGKPSEEYISKCPYLEEADPPIGGYHTQMEYDYKENNSLAGAYYCVNAKLDDGETYVIDFRFHGIILFVASALIIYLIGIYTVQVAVRLLQLAYLQLIAPIPIMMYLTPNGSDSLSKWSKQCLTTFLDFFIRVGIMYFAIFIITLLIDRENESIFWSSFQGYSGAGRAYIFITIIIAILIFARRVPQLLGEVLPMMKNAASLDLGLAMPQEMRRTYGAIGGALTAGAIGLVGGGPGILNHVGSGIAGTWQGLVGGAQGTRWRDIAANRAAVNLRNRQTREDPHTTRAGRAEAWARRAFGFNSRVDRIDQQIRNIDENYIEPLQDRIQQIQNNDIRPLQDQIQNIQNNNIRPIQDNIQNIQNNVIRRLQDQIQNIQNNDIRPLQDRIQYLNERKNEIDNSAEMREKTQNDRVIGFQKSLMDYAKSRKDVLNDDDVIGARSRADYLKAHYGEIDVLSHQVIDDQMISDAEYVYEGILDTKSAAHIDANATTDAEIAGILAQMSNATGNVVDNYASAKAESTAAKNRNTALAPAIARYMQDKAEYDLEIADINDEISGHNARIEAVNRQIEGHNRTIDGLNRTIEGHQATIDGLNRTIEGHQATVDNLNRQVEGYNRNKSDLERAKRNPQADIDAINRNGQH